MSADQSRKPPRRGNVDLDVILEELHELEATVDSSAERREVRRVRDMLELVPGRKTISRYTSRDVAEGFVGGIVFSLPLLVEGGVFEIAEWFASTRMGPVPVFLIANVVFVVALLGGLLYFTDIRDVRVRPLFGFIPKRLVALLLISLVVATVMMFTWGRLHQDDPTQIEQFGRITVVWSAAALGAALGDILPGESEGEDVVQLVRDLGDGRGEGE